MIAAAGALFATPATYAVNLKTSSLAGPFSLAFQLSDASGRGDANNIVSLSNFSFNGGSPGTVGGVFGGASGNFLSGITLTDSDAFFNAILQSFSPGSTLSFWVTLSNNADAGSFQDLFAISLLNASGAGVPTLDPSGNDTLASFTLNGSLNPPVGAWGTDPEPHCGEPRRTRCFEGPGTWQCAAACRRPRGARTG